MTIFYICDANIKYPMETMESFQNISIYFDDIPVRIKSVGCCRQQHIDVCQEAEDVDSKTMLEKQLESSESQLEKLLFEGKELVRFFAYKYTYIVLH
jgi:hypothetical protein